MIVQKKKIAAATLLALASAFLLAGVSFGFFPDQESQQPISKPIPKPENWLDHLFWAIQWIGLVAVIALTAVGAILLVSQIRSKKTE